MSDIWNNFWSDSSNRRQYFKATKLGAKVQKQVAKIKFLKECFKYRVIPTTIQPHYTTPIALSERARSVNENILGQASLAILKNHITEAKTAVPPLRAVYDDQVAHLHSLVDNEELHQSITQHLASRQ